MMHPPRAWTFLSTVMGALLLLALPAPAEAQLYNGYRRLDPMGVDRPPSPVPNTRRGKRRVY